MSYRSRQGIHDVLYVEFMVASLCYEIRTKDGSLVAVAEDLKEGPGPWWNAGHNYRSLKLVPVDG